jgi:hypothetical protein
MSLTSMVLAAVARPGGMLVTDIPADPKLVHGVIQRQRRKGRVFIAKISHRKCRYFDTQARADACVAVTPKPKSHGWGVVIKAGPRFDHSAPLIFTPKTKYTIAPTPPRALKSNTYLEFA